MRRPVAIFFLCVILLNTAGYYLVFEGWKWHNSLTWSMDDAQGTPELIVKIPFNIPYASDSEEWEKAQGDFEYQGEVYRIVKQKLTLDAVYVALVKDTDGSRINEQRDEYAKTFSDKSGDAKQSVKTLPGFLKEYISDKVSVTSITEGWSANRSITLPATENVIRFSASVIHPPERA